MQGDQLNQMAMNAHLDASKPGCIGVGATGARPTGLTAAYAGSWYYDTTLGLPVYWTGSGWKNAAGTAA